VTSVISANRALQLFQQIQLNFSARRPELRPLEARTSRDGWSSGRRAAEARSRWRHGATEAAEPLEADRGSVRPELRPRSSRGTEQLETDRGSVRPVGRRVASAAGRRAGEEEAAVPVKK
jgi:hypothetical protein